MIGVWFRFKKERRVLKNAIYHDAAEKAAGQILKEL